jgi:hypothetical protein
METVDRAAFRLLPSERVLWYGRRSVVPYDKHYVWAPPIVFALAAVFGLFAGLLHVVELPGVRGMTSLGAFLAALGVGLVLLPRYLLDDREYLVTDRRVLTRRGRWVRFMDRASITLGRIRWHRSAPSVGHLELVIAVPHGPLARKQRLVLHDVRDPDSVFAIVRGVQGHQNADDADLPLVDRLDPGELVCWGGHPEGGHIGWREVLTGLGGACLVLLSLLYGYNVSSILVELEELGLSVRSWAWVLFFLPVLIGWGVMFGVGLYLSWYGFVRARKLGQQTDYVLTDRRLLIRRGRTELSLDRGCIVDVNESPSVGGRAHLFMVLDAPRSRALAVGGLSGVLPARDALPPVLYGLKDTRRVKQLLTGESDDVEIV